MTGEGFPDIFDAIPARLRLPAFCVALSAGILLFQQIGFTHWGVGAWLPFMAFWLLPKRYWWAIVLTQILTGIGCGILISTATADGDDAFLGFSPGPVQFFLGNFVNPFTNMVGPWLMLRAGIRPHDRVSSRTLAWLHMAAMANFVIPSLKDVVYVLYEGRVGDIRGFIRGGYTALGGPDDWARLGEFFVSHLMGGFVGLMITVPLVLWALQRRLWPYNGDILKRGLWWLTPVMALYVALSVASTGLGFAELLRLLLMAAVIVFTVRHGWRGAALSVFATSCAIAIEEHFGGTAHNPVWLQLFISIVGAIALMFGSALEELHLSNLTLREMRDNLLDVSQRLQDSASRNAQSEERERKRLAAELHDEFGQTLVALDTQLRQATRLLQGTEGNELAGALAETSKGLRRHLLSTLESLRPASLDELGLYGAIAHGSLSNIAARAGLDYQVELCGDGQYWPQVDDAMRMAAYRVVQGAIANTVRHGQARMCRVRLRLEHRAGMLWLFVTVDDDGIGRVDALTRGHGLRGLEDRVVALRGVLRLRNRHPGIRIHALLRQPL